MRILVVSQYYYPEPFRINEICEAFVRNGNTVTVITGLPNYPDGAIYDGYGSQKVTEQISGVNVIRCRIRPRKQGNLNLALNYTSFVISSLCAVRTLKEKYDIVYGYQLSPVTSMIAAAECSHKQKIPFFLYCLDAWPASIEDIFGNSSIIHRLIKCIARRIYRSASMIGVSSTCFIEYLSELLGCANGFVYIPQHASEILTLRQNAHRIEEYADFINFMFLGNVGVAQNLKGIISALSVVHEDIRKKILFHIVGSGSAINEVKEECNKLCLNEQVIFHGRKSKDELPIYYGIADVCIVSLRRANLVGHTIPGKLQEYMSAGKAVLGFIDGDASFLIDDAKCGMCVPAENEVELSKAFEYIVNHSEQIAQWGKNAKDYYHKNFTLEHHMDSLEHELERLIQ